MSNQQPQFQQQPYQPVQHAAPKPPKKPHTKRNLILTGVGSLVLGIVIGSAPSSNSATDTPNPTKTVTVTAKPTAPATSAPAAPATTEAKPAEPAVKDFKLTVKTLTKQCFGSAGCNVTYRILVTYDGPTLDPSKTYEVLYEVRGGEDPVANKLTVADGESSVDEEEMVSTSKSSAKLTAVVTDVMAS